MADHKELIAELAELEKLSTEDRLKQARKRRQQQLKRFGIYDKAELKKMKKKSSMVNNNLPTENESQTSRKKSIRFNDDIVLLEAAARDDVEEVHRLLENGINPNSSNADGLTALHQCCIDNLEKMMNVLLQYNANVNARDSELWTPLHAAATCAHTHLCKKLIDRGADLLAVNAEGNMPYDICEDDKTLDLIENEMAAKGITQEMIDDVRCSTENQLLNEIKQYPKEISQWRDKQGASILHVAAANGFPEVCKWVLQQRLIDVSVYDNDHWQPIHAAAFWSEKAVIDVLADFHADLTAQTSLGDTPLDFCQDDELLRHHLETLIASSPAPVDTDVQTSLSAIEMRPKSSKTERSASIRRLSKKDKENLSRKEMKEEGKLRGSVCSEDGFGVALEMEYQNQENRHMAMIDSASENDVFDGKNNKENINIAINDEQSPKNEPNTIIQQPETIAPEINSSNISLTSLESSGAALFNIKKYRQEKRLLEMKQNPSSNDSPSYYSSSNKQTNNAVKTNTLSSPRNTRNGANSSDIPIKQKFSTPEIIGPEAGTQKCCSVM